MPTSLQEARLLSTRNKLHLEVEKLDRLQQQLDQRNREAELKVGAKCQTCVICSVRLGLSVA